MFFISEDLTINITRGDAAIISVSAVISGSDYEFRKGDVVRLKVFGKKDCANVVLEKNVAVIEPTYEVDIELTKEDTKIGSVINKPTDYWYEVELNPNTKPQTIVGYDEESGAKVFKLYPEGGVANE
jgi:hypothetical protein